MSTAIFTLSRNGISRIGQLPASVGSDGTKYTPMVSASRARWFLGHSVGPVRVADAPFDTRPARAHNRGGMLLALLPIVLLILGLLQYGWPSVVSWLVEARAEATSDDDVLVRIHDNIGLVLIGLAFVFTTVIAAVVVVVDDELGWRDSEPVLTALAATLGIVFAYGRLFPPQFWPSFCRVIDFQNTGRFERKKLRSLEVGSGQYWAIFLEVHNASGSAWSNYRITVRFSGQSGWELYASHGNIPASDYWDWKTEFRPVPRAGQSFLQVQASNTLAVAESQTIRFVVKTPDEPGESKLRISLVADGRLGEMNKALPVSVKEKLSPP